MSRTAESKGTPKAAPGARKRRRVTYTVGFRVDAHYLALLEKGAAAYGISLHEYARQRLVELLDRQEEVRLLEAATRTREELEDLREDLARLLQILLVNLGQADPAAVRALVDAHLRRE